LLNSNVGPCTVPRLLGSQMIEEAGRTSYKEVCGGSLGKKYFGGLKMICFGKDFDLPKISLPKE